MSFHLVNDKGFFGIPQWHGVISVHALQLARQALATAQIEPSRRQACDRALDWLEAFPVQTIDVRGFYAQNDAFDLIKSDQTFSRFVPMYVPKKSALKTNSDIYKFHALAFAPVFVRSSSDKPDATMKPNPSRWGWNLAKQWPKMKKDILVLMEELAEKSVHITIDTAVIKKTHNQDHRVCVGQFSIREYDVKREVASCEAYAIYIADFHRLWEDSTSSKQGYIGKKSQLGPLAAALMFESPTAAARYLDMSSFAGGKAAVVKVSMAVENIDPVRTPPPSMGHLEEGIALINRDRLEQGLAQASHDQLLKRLEDLGQAPEPKASAPRRM